MTQGTAAIRQPRLSAAVLLGEVLRYIGAD